MRESSIAKQKAWGAGSLYARQLGSRLRRLRLERRLRQRDVAGPLSVGFVSAVENGRTLPSLAALNLLAAALGVSPGEVLDGVNKD